jgi:hypothetical protein
VSWFSRLVNGEQGEERYSLTDYIQEAFQYNGLNYPYSGGGSLSGPTEDIPGNFEGHVSGAYKDNGVVFACLNARMRLFSEARFQSRRAVRHRGAAAPGAPVDERYDG